jgi:hypothetical protein
MPPSGFAISLFAAMKILTNAQSGPPKTLLGAHRFLGNAVVIHFEEFYGGFLCRKRVRFVQVEHGYPQILYAFDGAWGRDRPVNYSTTTRLVLC